MSALPLEVFTPAESLDFLKKALDGRKDDSDDNLNALAERLGHLPLALELASRYLNAHPRLSLDEYLIQSKEAFDHPSMKNWRTDLPAPTAHDLDLQRTFALSLISLQSPQGGSGGASETNAEDEEPNNNIALKLFQIVGYLAPNTPIPLEIFEKALELTSDQCDEALDTLFGLGLLRKSEDNLPTIHPLLAEYARGLAKEENQILESLVDILGTLSREAAETGLPLHFVPIRSHLPVTAFHAEKAGLQDAGILWNNYAYHLGMIADYPGARAAYERALKIDPEDATWINNLGSVMQDLGDLPAARVAFERALKIDEANFGADHPNVAIRVNNLGSVMQDLGDFTGARDAFERALEIKRKVYPPDHPSIKLTQDNLDSLEE